RTSNAKTVLQVIVGTWQVWHIIALKQAGRKVLGDLHEMLDSFAQRAQTRLLFLHLPKMHQIPLPNLRARLLLMISQNMSSLIHQRIGVFEGRPKSRCAPEGLGKNLLQVLQCRGKAFFCSTRAMESLIWVSRPCNLRPEASNGGRPSSVNEL